MAFHDDPFSPPKDDAEVPLELDLQAVPEVHERGAATRRAHQDFLEQQKHTSRSSGTSVADTSKQGRSYHEVHRDVNRGFWLVTRAPIALLLGWFTLSHLAFKGQWVFVDGVNLLFHEAGHVLFSWGGQTLTALGGTLGQLILPCAFAAYFYRWRHERFAAAACGWWMSENFVNIARYMHDAPVEELPLIGGTIHDWKFLFTQWGLYQHSRDIADATRLLGVVGMCVAVGYLLYKTLRPTEEELRAGNAL